MSNYKISNPIKNIYSRVDKLLGNNSYTISTDGLVSLNFTTILVNNENVINLELPTIPITNQQNVIYNFIILKKTGNNVFINTGSSLKIIKIDPDYYGSFRFIYISSSGTTSDSQGKWVLLNNFSQSNETGKDYDNVNSVQTVSPMNTNPFLGGFGYGVTYGGIKGQEKFIATGSNSDSSVCIFYSTDGETWTPSYNNPFINGKGWAITWGGNINIGYKFIAGGENIDKTVCIASSIDGINWTPSDNNPLSGGALLSVAFGKIKKIINNLVVYVDGFVGVGGNPSGSISTIYSTDGHVWIPSYNNPFSGFGGFGRNICFGKVKNILNVLVDGFVAVGKNPSGSICIAYSTDAINWTPSTINPFSGGEGIGVAWNGIIFVACGLKSINKTNNFIAYSTDGNTWTTNNNNLNPFYSNGELGTIVWIGGTLNKFVLTGIKYGGNYSIAYSTDGINWTNYSNDKLSICFDISYDGSKFVSVGYNVNNNQTTCSSIDGLNWVTQGNIFLDLNKKTFLIDNSLEKTYYLNNVTIENKNNSNLEYLLKPKYNNGVPVNILTYPQKKGSIYLFPDNPISIYNYNDEWYIKNNSNISFFSNHHDIKLQSTETSNYNIGNSVNIVDDNYLLTSFYNDNSEYKLLKLRTYEQKLNEGEYRWENSGTDFNTDININKDSKIDTLISKDKNTIVVGGTCKNKHNGLLNIYENRELVEELVDTDIIFYGVAWGLNKYVAVGKNNAEQSTISYSSDGITWNSVVGINNPFSGGSGYGITYGNNKFVAVGYNSNLTTTISYSSDGISWTSVVANNNPFLGGQGRGVVYGGIVGQEKFVAVGYNSNRTTTISYSSNGSSWTSITGNNPFSGVSGYGVTFGGIVGQEKFVAVGYNSNRTTTISYSINGITNWTASFNNPFTGGSGYGITWNDTKFVAVGYNSASIVCIAYSTDGINWTASSNNPFSGGSGYGITWNGNKFVAVGYNSSSSVCIAYSTDGISWTASSNNPFSGGTGYGVVWNGSKFVTVGYNNSTITISYSTDAVSWTDVISSDPFYNGTGYGVTYGDNKFVAVGNNYDNNVCISYSTDGINWRKSDNNPLSGGYGHSVSYGGIVGQEKFVAVGNNYDNTVCISYSTDSINWTPIIKSDIFYSGSVYGISSGTYNIVCVGNNYDNSVCIAYSTNGINWFHSVNNPFKGGRGNNIAIGKVKNSFGNLVEGFVAVGFNSGKNVCIAYSTNGINWVNSTNNPFSDGQGRGVVYGGNVGQEKFVAVGINSTSNVFIAYSVDGIVWTSVTDNPFGETNQIAVLFNVVWVGEPKNKFFATGRNKDAALTICSSSDGINWSGLSSPYTTNLKIHGDIYDISWSPSLDRFVAVGYNFNAIPNNTIYYSVDDAETWTLSPTNPFEIGDTNTKNKCYGVTWGGIVGDEKFVSVGFNYNNTICIVYSTDGIGWTASSNNPYVGGEGRQVHWCVLLNKFFAVGFNYEKDVSISYSINGIDWTLISNGSIPPFLYGSVYDITWVDNTNIKKFISVGYNKDNTSNILTSKEGIVWTQGINTDPFYDGKINYVYYGGIVGQEKFIAVGKNSNQTISIGYSFDGISNWKASNNNPFSGGIGGNSIVWGGIVGQEKYVAVGSNGIGITNTTASIAYSTDGIDWILSDNKFSGVNRRGHTVEWGGDKFVAGGYTGGHTENIFYSTNGINWTVGTGSPFIGNREALVYKIVWGGTTGQEKFVAVGLNNSIPKISTAYSTNGINWTAVNNTPLNTGVGLVWGGIKGQEKFVAVGSGTNISSISYSTDGIVWNSPTDDIVSFSIKNGVSVTWGGNLDVGYKFVVVGKDSNDLFKIVYSRDGLIWTYSDSNVFFNFEKLSSVTWGVDKFIIVGTYPNNTNIAYSYDGIRWKLYNDDPFYGGYGRGVVSKDDKIIIVGRNYNSNNTISYSSGKIINWISSTNNPFINGEGRGVIYGGIVGQEKFVAVGCSNNTTIAYSVDGGAIWTASANNPFSGGSGYGVGWGGIVGDKKFVAVGYSNISDVTIAYSTDGIQWTASLDNPFFGGQGNSIKWIDNKFIALGNKSNNSVSIVYSTDGIRWTPITTSYNKISRFSELGTSLSYSNNKNIAFSDESYINKDKDMIKGSVWIYNILSTTSKIQKIQLDDIILKYRNSSNNILYDIPYIKCCIGKTTVLSKDGNNLFFTINYLYDSSIVVKNITNFFYTIVQYIYNSTIQKFEYLNHLHLENIDDRKQFQPYGLEIFFNTSIKLTISANNKLIVAYPINLNNIGFSKGTLEYYQLITNIWQLKQSFPDITFPNINVNNKIQAKIILSSTVDSGVVTVNDYVTETDYRLGYYFSNNNIYTKSSGNYIDLLKNPTNTYNNIKNNNIDGVISDTGKMLIYNNPNENYLSIYN